VLRERHDAISWAGIMDEAHRRVRGRPVVTLTNQTLLHAPAREHSRKPDEFYALVESLCPAPVNGKLELFARESRPGWIAAGAEIGKFSAGRGA
jgi:N6-adenosine-specific RNA methylase IME4